MNFNHLSAIQITSVEAAKAHAGQTRKDGTTPYIVHPARVAALVEHYGGNHLAVLSAWLHDVFEDCDIGACTHARGVIDTLPLPAEDIQKIHTIIKALTKNPELPKEERIPDSLDRILNSPPEAILVKICDRIDNLVDADHRDREFKITYYRKSRLVAEKLGDAAKSSGYSEAHRTLENLVQGIHEKYPYPAME